ncbi:MAG TPA: alpha/beta hydrolase [Vicinamibacterales bacterium]|nr:alpha/beta hydrolase [Vicinamibacterales bacterium]
MRAALACIALVIAFVALIWLLQSRLIYFPATDLRSPAESGLPYGESVAFDTSDGLRLRAWFVRASGPPPHRIILVFNGNAGNRAYRAPLAASLHRHGFHVLLTDYRGYGGNPGSPSERGLAADARAALAYLLSREDIDRSRIVYFGESLGAAIALQLAVEHTPEALILRSPFTSLADVGQYHYPLLPVRLLLRDRFASIAHAHQVTCPVLVIAGRRDTIVPIDQTRRLYDSIVAPKAFVEIPSADHNDYELLAGGEMIESIRRFLQPL